VGRAGRAVDRAYGVLLSGEEDVEITDYFIRTAFPPQAYVTVILEALNAAAKGLSVPELEGEVNLRRGQIEKVLKLLSVEDPSPVVKQGNKWFATPIIYEVDQEKIDRLTDIRRAEQQDMLEYMECSDCLMVYLARKLDDPHARECGKCANCKGISLLPLEVSPDLVNAAGISLRRSYQKIIPRKQWPAGNAFPMYGFRGRIQPDLQAEEGRTLSLWGDAGWGELVKKGKYKDGRFSDDLIEGCVQMLRDWSPSPPPRWITCVPSLRHQNLVPDFAQRLADKLGMEFRPCVRKVRENRPQKEMENSFHQGRNLDGAFEIEAKLSKREPVLLLDDVVDSRWTFTVISALLRQAGCQAVHPMALAVASP
jgi:ATP-dependent DNA helicase RecQ